MDYTPEAWDADFEEFRSAVADAEGDTVICEHCDWIGSIEDIQDELDPVCPKCGHPIYIEGDIEDDCPMDGDAQSALASCGWGTDEDYGYYGDEW